ncbi:MAG: PcfJ domain-containing protein [Rhodopirellula sp.]|nr:PcfJ domain-containing protein [Rhodopirellula sp.]
MFEVDDCWNPRQEQPRTGIYDPWMACICGPLPVTPESDCPHEFSKYGCPTWNHHGDPEDLVELELLQLADNAARTSSLLSALLGDAGTTQRKTTGIDSRTRTTSDDQPVSDPEQLRLHADRLLRRDWKSLQAELAASLSPREKDCLVAWSTQALNDDIHSGTVALVTVFAPFRIRPLDEWNGTSGRSLVEHAFVRWPVPDFLYKEWECWLASTMDLRFRYQVWLILLGRGHSLHVTGRIFGWPISRKNQQFLSAVPFESLPERGAYDSRSALACLYSEVRRLGGDVNVVRRICSNSEYVINPLSGDVDSEFLIFWQETVCWLTASAESLTDAETLDVLDWALHEFTERQGAGTGRFSWKGRTPASASKQAAQYLREIAQLTTARHRTWLLLKWKSHDWDWKYRVNDSEWTVTELPSGQRLAEEGALFSHCVGSYAGRCVAGSSAIFSLACDDTRCLTIEVEPQTRRVRQARGARNRAATANEVQIINAWVNEIHTR